ncbi:MAG: DUF86 domain-containing protein [Candidatus Paceibacterota bacterium]|jgi:uncharacterized protein with HEPN domain
MVNQEKDQLYILHIIEAIERIESYVIDLDFSSFDRNTMAHTAVIRELEVVGEATKNLSGAFKNSRPNIKWPEIIGMRNKLIHEYFDIDTELVWQTIIKDLPELKKELV